MHLIWHVLRFVFRVSWHSLPVQPSHGIEDNLPDANDEADFDVPYTQAVLERFMLNMSKLEDNEYGSLSDLLDSLPDPSSYTAAKSITTAAAREKGVILEADENILRAFSPSEMKLYRHATYHKWTVEELVSTIKLIKSADSDFKVDYDTSYVRLVV